MADLDREKIPSLERKIPHPFDAFRRMARHTSSLWRFLTPSNIFSDHENTTTTISSHEPLQLGDTSVRKEIIEWENLDKFSPRLTSGNPPSSLRVCVRTDSTRGDKSHMFQKSAFIFLSIFLSSSLDIFPGFLWNPDNMNRFRIYLRHSNCFFLPPLAALGSVSMHS